MQPRVLVTGGAGFIGSHLVDGLLAKGQTVRVLDDMSTGLAGNLEHAKDRIAILRGSITKLEDVRKAVEGVETIYHLAALASVARSVESPLVSHEACATATLNVLNEARKAGVKRVVFAASSSAYGGTSSDAGQKETQELAALSPYAAAKLASEFYMQAFAHTYGIETVRLRFFNIFGPRQRADSPYSGVIAIFAGMMKDGKAPTIHGDGLQSRDFTHVENAVQALMLAGSKPGVSGKVFNVGTGISVTILELVAALNLIYGSDLKAKHAEPRAGDVKFSRADITRIRTEMGYEPTVDFEEGLRRTVAWSRG